MGRERERAMGSSATVARRAAATYSLRILRFSRRRAFSRARHHLPGAVVRASAVDDNRSDGSVEHFPRSLPAPNEEQRRSDTRPASLTLDYCFSLFPPIVPPSQLLEKR